MSGHRHELLPQRNDPYPARRNVTLGCVDGKDASLKVTRPQGKDTACSHGICRRAPASVTLRPCTHCIVSNEE